MTETLRLELHLELASVIAHAEVSATPLMVQLDASALGRTVNSEGIVGLPLATRNFSQLAGLSPGVLAGVAMQENLEREGPPSRKSGRLMMGCTCTEPDPTITTGN